MDMESKLKKALVEAHRRGDKRAALLFAENLKMFKKEGKLPPSTPKKSSGIYHGDEAIAKVEEKEGRPLSLAERRVVEEEGYAEGTYTDDKGVETAGVGQTGKFMGKSFTETFSEHEKEAASLIEDFDTLPEYLQAEFVQAAYRGDLQQGKKTRKLFNEGDYQSAAVELLNHKEYKKRKAEGDDGVTRRLESLRDAIVKYSKEKVS